MSKSKSKSKAKPKLKGRPPGSKDRRPRGSVEREIAPPEVRWLSKEQAAGELGVSLSSINRNLRQLGAVKMMGRVRFDRAELSHRARKLSPQPGGAPASD